MFKYCKTVTVFLPYHVLTSHMYLYMVDDDPSCTSKFSQIVRCNQTIPCSKYNAPYTEIKYVCKSFFIYKLHLIDGYNSCSNPHGRVLFSKQDK